MYNFDELISFFEHQDINKLNPEMKNIFLHVRGKCDVS